MTPFSLALVSLRLMSVWLFMQQLRELPTFYYTYYQLTASFSIIGTPTSEVISLAATPIIMFVVSIVLWFGAPLLARRISEIDVLQMAESSQYSREWLAVGLTLIGVWLFLPALSHLAAVAFAFIGKSSPLLSVNMNREVNTLQTLSDAIQLVLSTLLILKSYSALRVLESARRDFRDEKIETA